MMCNDVCAFNLLMNFQYPFPSASHNRLHDQALI